MDIREFRIGNIVKWDLNDPRDWEDDFDYGYSESSLELWQLNEHERISYVPITEEWLIKLGFERKSKDNEFVWVTKYYMFLNVDSGWFLVINSKDLSRFVMEIYSLKN